MQNNEVVLLSRIDGFMVLPFFSPARLDFWIAGPEEAKNPAGKKILRLIQIRFSDAKFVKNAASLSR
jgi:hypothetical protein